MTSPHTLDDADRRLVALWAADCAERVLPLFEAEAPEAIARGMASNPHVPTVMVNSMLPERSSGDFSPDVRLSR